MTGLEARSASSTSAGGPPLGEQVVSLLGHAVADGVCSAATVGIEIGGEVVLEESVGVLATTGDDGRPIPEGARRPATTTTPFDLASVTKTYSAYTLLGLVADGVLALDEPIATWLPTYGTADRRGVTLRHLLTHTSGLPATWTGWHEPLDRALAAREPGAPLLRETPLHDRQALVDDLARTPLGAPPGSRWEYACTGFNTAMLVAEAATGLAWGDLVRSRTLEPLGMRATTFGAPVDLAAATEYQPQFARGVVQGIVHDESSWSLGGVAANAGLFAPVAEVLAFAEVLRAGADERTRSWMWDDQLPGALGPDPDRTSGASLGLRIGETGWMGALGGRSRGHTGFTGTSLQIDRDRGVSIVVLTNRVHPTRDGTGTQALRAAVADALLGAVDGRGGTSGGPGCP